MILDLLFNNDLAGYGSGSKVAAKATSCTKAAGATTASKATSATSATYSSTANYAKASAGATTASKATSATSATYSSTSNYAKNCSGLSFGKDSKGNWGYIPSGADTVTPFKSGTGEGTDLDQLYEAMQYSGLVTEGMTFDEICDILAAEYPARIYLIKDGVLNTDLLGSGTVTKTKNGATGYANQSIKQTNGICQFYAISNSSSGNGGYHTNVTWTFNNIDISQFNKFVIVNGKYKTAVTGYNSYSYITLGNIGFKDTAGSSSEKTLTTPLSYDISSLSTGEFKVTVSCFRSTYPSDIDAWLSVTNVYIEV